jgi:hypothetical protein
MRFEDEGTGVTSARHHEDNRFNELGVGEIPGHALVSQ